MRAGIHSSTRTARHSIRRTALISRSRLDRVLVPWSFECKSRPFRSAKGPCRRHACMPHTAHRVSWHSHFLCSASSIHTEAAMTRDASMRSESCGFNTPVYMKLTAVRRTLNCVAKGHQSTKQERLDWLRKKRAVTRRQKRLARSTVRNPFLSHEHPSAVGAFHCPAYS